MKAPVDDSTMRSVVKRLREAQQDLQALKDEFLLSKSLDIEKINEYIFNLECFFANTLQLLPEELPDGFVWTQCGACGAWISTGIQEPSWGELVRQEAIAGARAKAWAQGLGPHPSLYKDAEAYGQALPKEHEVPLGWEGSA